MIHLYKTYNKAKDVFVKPKLHWKFGLWKNDPCLPVWRRGPVWRIGKEKCWYNNGNCYEVKNRETICIGLIHTTLNGEPYTYKNYGWGATHKLPGKLKTGNLVWDRKYRKKWWAKIIPPRINFPMLFSFHIFNKDVTWKTKWTEYDIRYEFPPQFTIVFFGLSLSFWLNPEIQDKDTESFDHYWEGLLSYLYGKYKGDLIQTVISQGCWTRYKEDGNDTYFAISKNYIKPEYWDQYEEAIELYNELKDKNDDNDI